MMNPPICPECQSYLGNGHKPTCSFGHRARVVNETAAAIAAARTHAMQFPKSRESALVLTKLDEAELWLTKVQ